jgi:lysophospholipase L1-like esterase
MGGKAVLTHIEVINQLLASVCKTQGVALIGLTNKLQTDQVFIKALQDGDGLHPVDAGFDCIAKHLLASPAWSAFLELAANDRA